MATYRYPIITCVIMLLCFCTCLHSQQDTRDEAREAALWRELELSAPGMVGQFKEATVALDSQNYEAAARLYHEITDIAPAFDPAWRRGGMALVSLGKIEEGLAWLDSAVAKKRSPENLISLAQSLAYPGQEQATLIHKQQAVSLAREANALYTGHDISYPALLAQIALEIHAESDFRTAVTVLQEKYAGEMLTHYFSGLLAIFDEDWTKAEEEIQRAGELGLAPEIVQSILDSGVQSQATVWHWVYYTLYAVSIWAGGLLLLFVVGKLFSRLTLRSIETADPNGTPSPQEQTLRGYYRKLITIAGTYYYISLPFVILIVLAAAASVTYAFMSLGRIPVGWLLALVIGALITVFKMVQTLFIREKVEDPGRLLSRDEAPGLWALAGEVAETVGTRPVDEIRITTGTELAVYEKGTRSERNQDRASRVLILGVGVLNDFGQNEFRSVLAHEYGHFSHRDTAGGDIAFRVNSDMIKSAVAMAESGVAVWWNLGFHFLRLYHLIFRRISHGATRLQEVLADRVAVYHYGRQAFEDGLRHVIHRSTEFDYLATEEVNAAIANRRSLKNLYTLQMQESDLEGEMAIREAIQEALNRTTTDDDTHPAPAERFRLAEKIQCKAVLPVRGTVWDFFLHREALMGEMNGIIEEQVAKLRLHHSDTNEAEPGMAPA